MYNTTNHFYKFCFVVFLCVTVIITHFAFSRVIDRNGLMKPPAALFAIYFFSVGLIQDWKLISQSTIQ